MKYGIMVQQIFPQTAMALKHHNGPDHKNTTKECCRGYPHSAYTFPFLQAPLHFWGGRLMPEDPIKKKARRAREYAKHREANLARAILYRVTRDNSPP